MSNLGEEIFGTLVFDGKTFEVGYRFNGPSWHQGGYSKCLRIYNGNDTGGTSISGHEYFGDDKFEVLSADVGVKTLKLEMSYPLTNKEDRYNFDSNKSKFVLITKKN